MLNNRPFQKDPLLNQSIKNCDDKILSSNETHSIFTLKYNMYYKILAFSPKKDHTKSQLLRSSESTYEEVSNVYTLVLSHFILQVGQRMVGEGYW